MASENDDIKNEFTGASESVVQAGIVQGGIHYHETKGFRFPPPHQLPIGVAGFVNRESSIAQLDQLLSSLTDSIDTRVSGPAISAITGTPGVGKTALALHWAHQVRSRFPDGDLYIDMGGYGSGSPLSPEQALDIFLRSFNVDPEKIPIDTAERVALYRSILGDKKVLVVIDNVSSVRQARNLIPGSHRCLAIVTSRSSLSSLVAREGATRVTLDVLPPEDAIRLLAEIIGDERIESDPEAANRVAELCGYLPLALRVVAERVAGRSYLPLSELVRELVGEQTRLDALASEEDELTDIRVVFSWSYRALSSQQQRIFRLIGLHAGPEFGSEVAAALIDVPVPTVNLQLRELAKVHLIQEVSVDRYRLHDLLRAYSVERGQREESQRERTHAVRRMMGWYLLAADAARQVILPYSHTIAVVPPNGTPIPPMDDVASAMGWYEKERLNLLGVLRQAMDLGQYDVAWKLPVISDGFFELHSYWLDWVQVHREGLLAAQTIGDATGEASNLFCLGDAGWRLGNYGEALDHYEAAFTIAQIIEDRWLEGFSLRGQGLINQELRRFDQSIAYFERALEIFRSSDIRRGEGMSLLSLGKSYRGLGQLDEAIRYCEPAVEIFQQIGDEWSQAWGLMPLADTYIEQHEFELAEQSLQGALTIFRRFADRRSEALVQYSLGIVLHNIGDTARAREHWINALEIFEDLGDPHVDETRAFIAALENQ